MFAECIHSFADTTNQIILAYGIHKSTQVSVCVCVCCYLLLCCHALIIHQMFVMFMFADGRSRSPVRIYKYEICVVIDIGRWNLLRWHRPLILPWHNGFDGARTVRGFLLGILYTWRFIIVRRCNTHGGCEFNTTISKAGKRVISRVCDSWRRSIGKCSIIWRRSGGGQCYISGRLYGPINIYKFIDTGCSRISIGWMYAGRCSIVHHLNQCASARWTVLIKKQFIKLKFLLIFRDLYTYR